MKIAVIALTFNGAELAKHLAHLLGAQVYLPEKFISRDTGTGTQSLQNQSGQQYLSETAKKVLDWSVAKHGDGPTASLKNKRSSRSVPMLHSFCVPNPAFPAISYLDPYPYPLGDRLADLVERIFNRYDALVFIMAAGIVVRSIAPFIKDKKTDPAVVVLDEKGKNVISLLSGHIGGANELTLCISHLIGANPVITTASDVNDTLAVDMLAKKLGCEIENQEHLTAIAAFIVNGQKVGFYSDYENVFGLPDNVIMMKNYQEINKSYKGAVLLTHHILKDITIPHVLLRPKSVVIGVGCRKNTPKEKILEAVSGYLQQLSISSTCIKHIATVDVKAAEKGLIQAAKDLQVPLIIIDRAQIRKVEHEFECSPFVKETIGIGCVAEPCAVISCCKGRLIGGKYIKDGVTVAVAVEKKLRTDR